MEETRYVVFTNYGLEGWKITGETTDFQQAVKWREESLGHGNSEVEIFERVKTITIVAPKTKSAQDR